MPQDSPVLASTISSPRNKFNHSIENFRAIAILFVIFSHSDLTVLGSWKMPFSFLLGDATTFFVFISGFLFYHLSSKEFCFNAYLSKKFKFTALPYLFLSAITISTGLFIKQNDTFNLEPFAYIAWSIWTGGPINAPLWFIPMIWHFFLAAPILIKIAKSKLLPVALVISLLFSLFSSRPLLNANPTLSALHFLGFYMLGMYLAKGGIPCKKVVNSDQKIVYFFIVLIGLTFISYADQAYRANSGFFSGIFKPNFMQIGKFFMLITIYCAVTRYLNKKNNILSYIADISFGLFFLHWLWKLVADKGISYLSLNRPASILLIELTAMLIGSILCVEIARKFMKKRSRYVVGC